MEKLIDQLYMWCIHFIGVSNCRLCSTYSYEKYLLKTNKKIRIYPVCRNCIDYLEYYQIDEGDTIVKSI